MFLIFPHQLFYNTIHLIKTELIYLIEEPRFFTDFNFHKLKLAYHRASMKCYYDYLITNGFKVKYYEFHQISNKFYNNLENVRCVKINDFKLEKKLQKIKNLTILENINFLIKIKELNDVEKLIHKNNRYHHDVFYKYQRIKLNILVENNKPIGGKWSFDTENRKPLPKNYIVPKIKLDKSNKYKIESIEYINKHFNDNYGDLSEENFIYPIDNKGAKKWLNRFLKNRLKYFGIYQDAVKDDEHFIYHSMLSPMMNIGIITDIEVVKKSYNYYLKHKTDIPIQSIEAFLRQIIGWRNYVYTLYLLQGENMYESNLLNHNNKLPYKQLWTATTEIKPIDDIIKKIIKYAYAHHIERLMYLGSYLLLLQIKPKEVYKIFMEWTIDAYDWTMVPNIMGMSQYATDIMMTRPYFSSYNYILRMSNYKKDDWCDKWEALYYNFINKHKKILSKNYAIANQVKNWLNKSKEEKNKLLKIAKNLIKL